MSTLSNSTESIMIYSITSNIACIGIDSTIHTTITVSMIFILSLIASALWLSRIQLRLESSNSVLMDWLWPSLNRIVVFEINNSIWNSSTYLSFTTFFVNVFVQSMVFSVRRVSSTFGCHASIAELLSINVNVFYIVVSASNDFFSVASYSLNCWIAIGTESWMYL